MLFYRDKTLEPSDRQCPICHNRFLVLQAEIMDAEDSTEIAPPAQQEKA